MSSYYEAHTKPLTVGERLLAIYEESGFRITTGWNSHHFRNWRDAPFTSIKKDGRPLSTGGGGVSWQEIPCFELISYSFSPAAVLVIGNSFGWSTLLLSLLWPEARVVAMDIGVQTPVHPLQRLVAHTLRTLRGDGAPSAFKPTLGIDLTNELARKHRLNVEVVLGTSPQDVHWVVDKYLGGPPQFVFVDGGHSVDQVLLDFEGCYGEAGGECVYLFHDVINWRLKRGFDLCQKKSRLAGGILWRTPSGMGLLYPESWVELGRVSRAFGEDEAEMASVRAKLARWRRTDWIERNILGSRAVRSIRNLIVGRDHIPREPRELR